MGKGKARPLANPAGADFGVCWIEYLSSDAIDVGTGKRDYRGRDWRWGKADGGHRENRRGRLAGDIERAFHLAGEWRSTIPFAAAANLSGVAAK